MAGVETGDRRAGDVRGWLDRMGWGGWMEEGGQAERSTRGGLRGPRGPRGEKLEKGRFKYQPPRGGPRARCLYLASFFLSRTDASLTRALSFSAPPRCHPLATLCRSSLMHTHRGDPHRKICTQTDTLTHTSIDPRPEKRRLRAVRRWRTVRQCYVLIGRPLPTLLFFADRANFLHITIARAYVYGMHIVSCARPRHRRRRQELMQE